VQLHPSSGPFLARAANSGYGAETLPDKANSSSIGQCASACSCSLESRMKPGVARSSHANRAGADRVRRWRHEAVGSTDQLTGGLPPLPRAAIFSAGDDTPSPTTTSRLPPAAGPPDARRLEFVAARWGIGSIPSASGHLGLHATRCLGAKESGWSTGARQRVQDSMHREYLELS
jgi:hypothetical protein